MSCLDLLVNMHFYMAEEELTDLQVNSLTVMMYNVGCRSVLNIQSHAD